GRRLDLAKWLTEPNSRAAGLLSRVMVNRLWQHLFGRGLVPTPENFGLSGEPPTHQELLDWLSSEFVHNGWRIKPMLKLMMMSTAYRQRSQSASPSPFPSPPGGDGRVRGVADRTADPEKVDPGNQLL